MHVNPKIKKILAIIVTLAIITGISIGTYFLFEKLLHPPCPAGQKKYSEYDNQCLSECKDDTPNICPTKDKDGNPQIICRPKCKDGTTYNVNSCNDGPFSACKPICDADYHNTPHYDNATKTWECGMECPNLTTKDNTYIGTDICKPTYYCNKTESYGVNSTSKHGNKCNRFTPDEYCNTNNPSDAQFVRCYNGASECENQSDKYYCPPLTCKPEFVKICQDNSDCQTGDCKKISEISIDPYNIYTKLKNEVQTKHLDDIQICYSSTAKSLDTIPQISCDNACKAEQISKNNQGWNVCCSTPKIGINAKLQCTDNDNQNCVDTTEICPNGWQENNTTCAPSSPPSAPVPDINNQGYCCAKGHATGGTGPENKGCCIFPVTSGGPHTDANACMNTTPDNLNDLTGFYGELLGSQTTCTDNTECASLNTKLATQILKGEATPASKYYSMVSTSHQCSDPTYKTKAACNTAQKTWTASPNYTTFNCGPNKFILGACSDGVSTTEADCTTAKKTWTNKYTKNNLDTSASKYCQLSAGYLNETEPPFKFFIDNNELSSVSTTTGWAVVPSTLNNGANGTGYSIGEGSLLGCVNDIDFEKITSAPGAPSHVKRSDDIKYWWRPDASKPNDNYWSQLQYNITKDGQTIGGIDKYACMNALNIHGGIQSSTNPLDYSVNNQLCTYKYKCNDNNQILHKTDSTLHKQKFSKINYTDFKDTKEKITTSMWKDNATARKCYNQNNNHNN